MSIVLSVSSDVCEALFFTSNPNWAEYSRRATKEELAMAGFVYSKPTYLAYVKRPAWNFEATDLTYPLDWVLSLRKEFSKTVTRVIEVA